MTSPLRVPTDDQPNQLDRFKQAARDLETDDDPERFRERGRQAGEA